VKVALRRGSSVPQLYQLTVHFQDGDSHLCIRAESEQQAEAIGQELFPHCSLEAALRQLPKRGWIGQPEQEA
jgi:hypothetical protein